MLKYKFLQTDSFPQAQRFAAEVISAEQPRNITVINCVKALTTFWKSYRTATVFVLERMVGGGEAILWLAECSPIQPTRLSKEIFESETGQGMKFDFQRF